MSKHVVADIAMELTLQMTRLVARLPAPACPKPEQPVPEPTRPTSLPELWPSELSIPPLRAPEPDPPKPLERWPIAIRLGASIGPEFVAMGWGSLGFSAEVGARYRWASVGVEAHGDPPLGSIVYPQVGAVSFARASGTLSLCGHWGWFTGCAVGDAGRFLFPDRAHVLPASVFYGAAGGRLGAEFPVAPPRLFLRVTGDVLAPIHPASYAAAGVNIFEAAGPSFCLGFGLLTELPL